MSKNQVFAGDTPAISLPVPAGTRSGDAVKVGAFIGVAETDRAGDTVNGQVANPVGHPAGYAAVAVDGTYSLPCSDAVAGPGTPIYITGSGPFTLTTTVGSNTYYGATVDVVQRGVASGGSKASGAGNVNVKLARI